MYWDKAPRDLIALATMERWSPERPAPDLIGYLVAQRVEIECGSMSIRQLAEHCGWKTWKARKILTRLRENPHETSVPPRTNPHESTHTRPTANAGNAEEPRNIPHETSVPPRTNPHIARASLPERREDSEQSKEAPSSSEDTPAKASRKHVLEAWAQIVAACGETPKAGPVPRDKLGKKYGTALQGVLREFSVADIVKVIRWWRTSNHKRARDLRQDGYSVLTCFRHMEEYLGFASIERQPAPEPWQPQQKQHTQPPPTGPHPLAAQLGADLADKFRSAQTVEELDAMWTAFGPDMGLSAAEQARVEALITAEPTNPLPPAGGSSRGEGSPGHAPPDPEWGVKGGTPQPRGSNAQHPPDPQQRPEARPPQAADADEFAPVRADRTRPEAGRGRVARPQGPVEHTSRGRDNPDQQPTIGAPGTASDAPDRLQPGPDETLGDSVQVARRCEGGGQPSSDEPRPEPETRAAK